MYAERNIVLPILSVCLSVCLSIYPITVLCQKEWIFLTFWQGHHSTFYNPTAVTKFEGEPLSWALNTRGWENFANIAIYLGNCTR